MKKKKTYTELVLEVRRSWRMNPVTRIHDSGAKDVKKQRRNAKKSCRSYMNDGLQDFLTLLKRNESLEAALLA